MLITPSVLLTLGVVVVVVVVVDDVVIVVVVAGVDGDGWRGRGAWRQSGDTAAPGSRLQLMYRLELSCNAGEERVVDMMCF